ncbi:MULTISPECIES: DUF4232 domain-containing protein [unclassified Streptomyces]|uniref:DUF4232 domain-containing protein n=1 Tax=unclassified Streptomyces TaxID=2593676 RepID=UPI002E2E6A7F|nr:DUF4232 domain-containing protein [Streptomyces sp. NBC_00223]
MRNSSLAVGAAGAAALAAAVFGAAPATASTPVLDTTPMCATSQLTASLGGGDAGAGNLYRYLVLTNHSSTTCHLTGYPGLSMLDAKGNQIGAPATRAATGYAPVVLTPGGSASDTIHTINHQGTCLPTSTSLRIYPPGNTAALVFAGQVTDCDNLFTVTPLSAGKGGTSLGQAPTAVAPASSPAPTPTSAGGRQVTAVPSGAPDTGVTASRSGGSGTGVAVGAAAAGVLALGGLGVVAARRRKVRG